MGSLAVQARHRPEFDTSQTCCPPPHTRSSPLAQYIPNRDPWQPERPIILRRSQLEEEQVRPHVWARGEGKASLDDSMRYSPPKRGPPLGSDRGAHVEIEHPDGEKVGDGGFDGGDICARCRGGTQSAGS